MSLKYTYKYNINLGANKVKVLFIFVSFSPAKKNGNRPPIESISNIPLEPIIILKLMAVATPYPLSILANGLMSGIHDKALRSPINPR